MDLSEIKEYMKARHPWELSRARCVSRELEGMRASGRVLDVGCGDMFVDHVIESRVPGISEICGVDTALLSPGRDGKVSWARSLGELPEGKFDVVLMLDVLEHVADDAKFLSDIASSRLSDNGTMLITVPAFMRLFSQHDRDLRHYRRYDRKSLRRIAEGAGLEIRDESYFYASLAAVRALTRNAAQDITSWKHGEDSPVTRLARSALDIDYDVCRALSRAHIYIGGLSLMAAAKKKGTWP